MFRVCRWSCSNVADKIASRVSPVRSQLLDPKFRFKSKFENLPFTTVLQIVAIPTAVCFITLSLTPGKTIQGWRVLSHLGPYHVPALVDSGLWRKALYQLELAQQLQLTESEVSQLLTDIEVVTQRRMAVREIVQEHGFQVFLPVFEYLSAAPPSGSKQKSPSLFEANLRVVMDVVAATPAQDRELPISVIEQLVSNNQTQWESTDNEDTMRFREYRMLLLLKLLQNEQNAIRAKKSVILMDFFRSEKVHAKHIKFATLPLMPLLYQFKTSKLGYEFEDISLCIDRILGVTDSVSQTASSRESLPLPMKLDFVNFEKLVYLTLCYSSLRVIPLISEYSFVVLKASAFVMGKAVVGSALLETIYRAVDHVIQSKPYYDAAKSDGTVSKYAISAVVVSFQSLLVAAVIHRMPYCFAPFALMKFRDSFVDGYRFI